MATTDAPKWQRGSNPIAPNAHIVHLSETGAADAGNEEGMPEGVLSRDGAVDVSAAGAGEPTAEEPQETVLPATAAPWGSDNWGD